MATMSSREEAVVLAVNTSTGGIPKHPVQVAQVVPAGLQGDLHDHAKHDKPERAITLMDVELLEELSGEGYDLAPGTIGENITVRHLDVQGLAAGDMLHFSGGVELELVEPRRPCFVLDSIDETLKTAIVGRCGFLARVERTGELRPGESITVVAAGASADVADQGTPV